ncbi:MAG: hypothetical protein E7477_07040 [Ruminococcaceae bacterium]|nr:hypothetical protein [Oscillospiraceae bacterium]
MKKFIRIMIVMAMIFSLCAIPMAAQGVEVTVTIANGDIMVHDTVSVSDADGDGVISIADALYAAHEENYDGGASAGFGTEDTQWGISLMKLWGVENGGSYGYQINNGNPMSLADPIKDGDYVYSYVYTDTVGFSDTYTFFNELTVNAKEGQFIDLILSAAGYDENWAPITLPVEGATITINGEKTEFVTDAEGKVSVIIDKAGKYTVSAVSETMTLVPPVCTATVAAESNPSTSDSDMMIFAATAIVVIGAVMMIRKRNVNEK